MTQELKQGAVMGPEPGFQGGGAEQCSCQDGGGQPQGDCADQQPPQDAAQTGYPGGYGPIADHAGDCSCGSQTGQPAPVGGPAPGEGYPGFAPMTGYPGATNPAPAPDSHEGGCSCGSQPSGPPKGMSPAGPGPQPYCEHHFAHPGPMPGAMPGPMPGPFPGPMPGPMPGVMPGPFPGAMPGPMPGAMPGAMPGMAYGVHPGVGPANSPMGQAIFQKDAQLGQMMGLFNDIVSGKSDMSQVAGFLGSMDSGFWKGAAVGAGLALLLSNSSVKEAVSGLFSGLMGRGGNDDQTAPAEGLGE